MGVQFLREHMSDRARIHYAITDTGGVSPNVVQAKASVLYMVRSNHVAEAVELQERVDRIAQGAALMTDTQVEKRFIDGLADTVPNSIWRRFCIKALRSWACPSIRIRSWALQMPWLGHMREVMGFPALQQKMTRDWRSR